jgi:hypothetical protein
MQQTALQQMNNFQSVPDVKDYRQVDQEEASRLMLYREKSQSGGSQPTPGLLPPISQPFVFPSARSFTSSPVYAFDDSEIRETAEHARYIQRFRVHLCVKFSQGACSPDDFQCFDAHGGRNRRRKPFLQHGRFNYIPTRCRYVLKDKFCPQGVHCRFSHTTEEMIYHPSKYKTKMCTYPLGPHGGCIAYGMHCAKAHHPSDLRAAVYEPPGHRAQMGFTFDDWPQFVCPPQLREQEREFYMYHYRTMRCKDFPWDCNCNGLKYHRPKDRRRGPLIAYTPVACNDVKSWRQSDGLHLVKSNHSQRNCSKAHTLLELMYHPQVYKTGLCEHFDEHDPSKWNCVWKRGCAHAHGRDELRNKEVAIKLWNDHLRLFKLRPEPMFTNTAFSPFPVAQLSPVSNEQKDMVTFSQIDVDPTAEDLNNPSDENPAIPQARSPSSATPANDMPPYVWPSQTSPVESVNTLVPSRPLFIADPVAAIFTPPVPTSLGSSSGAWTSVDPALAHSVDEPDETISKLAEQVAHIILQ